MSKEIYNSHTLTLAHSNEPDLVEQRRKNSHLPVNRLSPDLLSRIMLIGVDGDRQAWAWKSRQAGSQEVASHVCSYWRQVAINSPILWTFIHIFSNPPHGRVGLYLSRAGSRALLDFLIDLRTIYSDRYDYPKLGASQQLSEILEFLHGRGAGASCWRSLYVRSSRPDVLPVLFGYLNHSSPSDLHSFRFECDIRRGYFDPDRLSRTESNTLGDAKWFSVQSRNLLGSPLLSLRDLELVSAAWPLFIEPMTPLPSLRYLAITLYSPYSAELVPILECNPQLERLYLKIDTYYYRGNYNSCRPLPVQSVVLPSLRSFYINMRDRFTWVLNILSTIKAPMLRHFTITCDYLSTPNNGRKNLVSHVSTGSSTEYGAIHGSGDSGIADGPVYPSIESLDISQFHCKKDEFTRLVTPFLHLTHLALRRKQAQWLSETPWVVPTLESLSVPSWSAEEASDIVPRYTRRGQPIKFAEFKTGYMKLTGLHTQGTGASGDHPEVAPQYMHYKYEDPNVQGDWQSIWSRRSGLVANEADAWVEQDDYDSDYESECDFPGTDYALFE